MNRAFHEAKLDEAAFLHATATAADLEYEYVVRMVGQEGLIRDIAAKAMAKKAISLLSYAGLEDPQDDAEQLYFQDESAIMTPSDIASREHFEWLRNEISVVNGYRLTYIDYTKIILDKTTASLDSIPVSTTVEASFSPSGVYVVKDQHTLGWQEIETIPLPVEPRDTMAMIWAMRTLMDLGEDN